VNPSLNDLRRCFEGAVPAVIATASSDGTPNVTYLSRVRAVDDERVALSNQFFSKTVRNLAENPRASVLLIDPVNYHQYRLTLAFERTERRGVIFDRLREDVDTVAAVTGMQNVFKLRAADIYRVTEIEQISGSTDAPIADEQARGGSEALAPLVARLSRCADLDAIVTTTVNGLAEFFGFAHSLLLLLDEQGRNLFTIASHGYPAEGVGSEVAMGDGVIGMAAERGAPIRINNVRQMVKYGMSVRRSYERHGEISPGWEIEVPRLPDAESRMAVPGFALGRLVGVLMVESPRTVAFTAADETDLSVLASVVANAIEAERARETNADVASAASGAARVVATDATPSAHVRFFAVDGSTFLDGDYLIKGVAGRILWSLLGHYEREGRTEFTNKEVRLDPTLELPEFRDNLDSRLLLLKRRLDERAAAVRIEKTGRGCFRIVVSAPLRLDDAGAP
jgi:predicted pyridoxine 5'-phosphate oxidase superfamily flavin-nucleotide-binding protein